uniref:Uncharacterized protein n=2 Tax=Xenopus tropicalis TaxID=8364 RepID=A0A1B8Y1V5_XENTR
MELPCCLPAGFIASDRLPALAAVELSASLPCNTTSCRRTVSHCPATPPAAVELSLTALQHHQLPCRRTVSHCPATPPAANCLSLPCITTSCCRTVSHCPATPPAAVELSLTAPQHHQLPCRRTVSHCPATPPAAVELSASLPCNTTSCRRTVCLTALQHHQLPCRRTVSHCPATPPAANCLSLPRNTTSCRRTVSHCPATPPAAVELSLTALQHHQLPTFGDSASAPLSSRHLPLPPDSSSIDKTDPVNQHRSTVGDLGTLFCSLCSLWLNEEWHFASRGPPLIHWSPSPNALQNCLPHCPATPPAAVELSASLPCNTTSCRRTFSHCPATPPAAVELSASLPCNTTSCQTRESLSAISRNRPAASAIPPATYIVADGMAGEGNSGRLVAREQGVLPQATNLPDAPESGTVAHSSNVQGDVGLVCVLTHGNPYIIYMLFDGCIYSLHAMMGNGGGDARNDLCEQNLQPVGPVLTDGVKGNAEFSEYLQCSPVYKTIYWKEGAQIGVSAGATGCSR